MNLHDILDGFIHFVLSEPFGLTLGFLTLLLAATYLAQFFCAKQDFTQLIWSRKSRLMMKALNWAIFAIVFIHASFLEGLHGVGLFRATARVAMMNLVLSELAYQLLIVYPIIKKKVRK